MNIPSLNWKLLQVSFLLSLIYIQDNIYGQCAIALPDTIISCSDSVVLDAGYGFSTYSWSTGESSQIIYALNSGIYSVTVDSNSCTYSDSVFIQINPINDSIDISICLGDSVFQNNVWIKSDTTYLDTIEAGTCDSIKTTIIRVNPLPIITPDFAINGDAFLVTGSTYQLTPDFGWKNGSIWNKTLLNLMHPFHFNVELFFGCNDATGADGIAFVLQPLSTSLGSSGAGIGYANISPSFGVEFDTYQNGGEPTYDHIAIQKDGILNHTGANNLFGPIGFTAANSNIEDCQWHKVKFDWDPVLQLFTVFFNDSLLISYTGDIINNIFSGDPYVYWGFTSATGALNNLHQIRFNYLLSNDSICRNDSVNVDALAKHNSYSYLWTPNYGIDNNTLSSPKFSPDTTTQYHLKITNSYGCAYIDSFTLEVLGSQLYLDDTIVSCSSDSILLSSGVGFDSYLWNTGDTTESFFADSSDTYFVTATDSIGCTDIGSVELSMGYNSNQGTSDTFLHCPGDTIILYADTNYSSYLWSSGGQNHIDTLINAGQYWVSISDSSGCSHTDTFNIVDLSVQVQPKDTSICPGDSVELNLNVAPVLNNLSCGLSTDYCYGANKNYMLGNGNNHSTLTTPYRGYYRNAKNQYLILATELNALGINAGQIKSIAFNVYSKNSWFAYENFSISIGCTQEDQLLSWQKNLFTVYNSNYNTIAGWNTHNFDHSYKWDGSSNLVIEVCYFTNSQPPVDYDEVYTSITSFNSVIANWNDNIISSCDGSDSLLYVNRPDMRFNICETPGVNNYTYSWNPSSILSDTSIQNPICYPNDTALVVGSINSNGCYVYDTATINIIPLPSVNLGNDTLICLEDTFVLNAGYYDTYLWSDGTTDSNLNVLKSGTYGITVGNSIGCINSDSITITKHQTLNLLTNGTNVKCHGDSSGIASVIVSGGNMPYTYLWNNGAQSATANNLSKNTYFVTIIDSNGCSISDSVYINEPNVLSSTISSTNNPCEGDTIGVAAITVVGGSQPYTYDWNNGLSNNSAQNLLAGKYRITITDMNNCELVDSVIIQEPLPINASDSIIKPLCNGDVNGSVLLNISGGNSNYTYSWNNGSNSKDLNNVTAGNYSITITDQMNCKDSFSFILQQPDSLSSQTTSTANYCNQDNGTLSSNASGGTAPYNYVWNTGYVTTNLTHGQYFVTITDLNSCQIIDTIDIDSIGNPNVDFSYNNICEGDSVVIIGIDNGYNINSWTWDIGNGLMALSGQQINPYFYSDTSLSIKLIATDIYGCNDTNTHQLNVYPVPQANFNTDTLWGCEELLVQFLDASTFDSISSYSWTFEGHGTDSLKDPTVNFNTVGSWDVILNINSVHGCTDQIKKDLHINIYKNPVADFLFSPTSTDILNPIVTFTNTSQDDINWIWSFGDNNYSSEQNPIHTYSDTGLYQIMLVVESSENCKDTSLNSIIIEKGFRIYVPNVFTPDRDGVNDMFGPVGTFGAVSDYTMQIYNRWGELIFESDDPSKYWDGTYFKNDKHVPEGNYVYFINIIDDYGEQFSYTGNFIMVKSYFH